MAPLRDIATLLLGVAAGVNGLQEWDHSLYTSSPPVYPSPETQGAGGWENATSKANAFMSNMTLEEKVSMLTGANGPCVGNIAPIERLGFKGLCLSDGPLSLRTADYVSVFPAGLTAAASWDRDLIHTRGRYLGEEFRAKGSHIFLGPVAAPLGRSAMNGRNWEGFSPDPYLTGVAMEETIEGVQSAGCQATAKHLIAYEQETQRNPAGTFEITTTPNDTNPMSISSNLDDRTMHELYLWPFANAVHANVASVMCAYNRINGSWACQNSKVMNGLLKEELGFQGYVQSDWGGTHSGVASVESGLDMTMPGAWNWQPLDSGVPSWFGGNLTQAVRNGSVTETRLNDMVRRVLLPYFALGQDQGYPLVDPSIGTYPQLNDFESPSHWKDEWTSAGALGSSDRDVRGNHSWLIRELGAAGTVLLKNVNHTLPLKAPKRIGVFGNAAGDLTNGPYPHSDEYEYGCLPAGGGSGSGRFSYLISPLEAIKARAQKDGSLMQYILNNTQLTTQGGYADKIYPAPDVCLVFLKTWAAEGDDRTTLHVDWDGDEVVNQVAQNCSNTVVITHAGGLNVMPWADHPNVTAILAAHLPGSEIGNSLVDILYGATNPSGHLPYTIAYNESDYEFAPITRSVANTTDTNAWQSDFTERLLIDYRYFDMNNISVRYEFGFGLSYTTFQLSNLVHVPLTNESISALPAATDKVAPGGNPALWTPLYRVSATITNTGNVTGAAVPQLYLSLPSTAGEGTPAQQLRGFEKVPLKAGESKVVEFELMRRDLSIWDVEAQQWRIPAGEMGVTVGLSSRDLQVAGEFTVL
ncbi:glycoside hydrolase family 3 protein [Saccharata proteae CBS 121410]|uniref:Probable beta-glucosidase G n=1 Tax=Saccharata proteae CBS 121410 TaxID=1314787 RepID=A0A9P4HRM2_9PEZI|nr:glycoside hydrolase family 3 protein [Saccharata proteae CBS 121410]